MRPDFLAHAVNARVSGIICLVVSFVGSLPAFAADTTPPTKPVVTDDGAYTKSSTSLHAKWMSSDPDSGIAAYQYLIRQDSPSGPIIVGWTSVGLSTAVTRTGLSLATGKKYYFGVRAKNAAGLWSAVGYSNGILVDSTAPSGVTVTDDGVTTPITTTLHATWTSSNDPESGVVQYQYLIRQDSTSGTIVVNWTSAGLSTAVTKTGLTLLLGKTYFYGVRAKNGAGLYSAVLYSDGIKVIYRVDGLDFSPYIDGQDPNLGSTVPESQLWERMEVVAPYTEWIRIFGSTGGLEKAGSIAHDLDLKAACSAWLSQNLSANNAEVTNLISTAQAGHCDMAIVGSEVLLRHDLSESQLLAYINQVKQAVPAWIPVTTADVYGEILAHPAVVDAVDVLLVNYFPYWEGVDVLHALAVLHDKHKQVVAAADGKQVVVSETGWPSCGNQIGEAVPSLVNASSYFLNFISWARANGVMYFYFEGLDETWKAKYEGPQGACWGVWDKSGVLKPGMQDVFNGKTISDNWSGTEVVGGPGTPAIAFTSVPPYGSFNNLKGQVQHVRPVDFNVAVYIKVGAGWWTKPYWDQPLTRIWPDGIWTCDITTGGIDELATEIIAYLVPTGYNPPLMSGATTLPAELDQNAVAKVQTTRTP